MRATMLLSTIGIGGAMISMDAIWQSVATALGSAAVWAQRHATPEMDEYEELACRLRRPWRWTARHPVQAAVRLKRKIDTRQQ